MPAEYDSRDDSRYDSYDSRYDSYDSRYDSTPPRPRNRATLPVVLASVGLGINLLVVVAAGLSLLGAGMLNFVILPALGLVALTGLTINVLAVVFGLSAARSEMRPRRKAACRVSAWVALAQVLTVLGLIIAGVVWLPGMLYPPPPPTLASTPATMPAGRVDAPPAADERPTTRGRGDSTPTKRERGE
jgi:hypothetical protein